MNEIKINDAKEKNKKKGINFYVALGICILAVGVAGWTTYDSIKRFTGPDDDVNVSNVSPKYKVKTENSAKNTARKPTSNANSESKQMSRSRPAQESDEQQSVSVNAQASGTIVYPTSKDIIKDFSGENPVFSKTLKDWRTHEGIDLAAEQGSKIKSITNGKVKEIYNDPLYGTTMVVEHEGGFVAYYSGLGETTLVNANDTVEAGQEIASINDSPCEAADGYHLHLAIKKDGKFINPKEILG